MEHDIIVISPDNTVGDRDKVLLGPIAKALRNPAFKATLAQSMVAPIRRSLDYQGIARKVFTIEPLPQGAIPYYFKGDE